MNENQNEILNKFWDYWEEQMRKGISSSFSRMEVLSIEMFLEWLIENYDVIPKRIKKENKE